MKMFKKVSCVFMCCMILTTFMSFSLQAKGISTGGVNMAAEVSFYEENPEMLLSPDSLRQNGYCGRQVHSFADDVVSQNNSGIAPAAIPGVSFYIRAMSVPVVKQKNGFYCGPATVVQNLEYISDGTFNMTQSQVGAILGTDTAEASDSPTMINFMNAQIEQNNYSDYLYVAVNIHSSSFNESFYVDTIYSNCYYYDWPAFGSFTPGPVNGYSNCEYKWPYTLNDGHFVSYSGLHIDASFNDIRLTDPNYQRVFGGAPDEDASYWVRAPICMATMNSFIW